MDAAGLVTAAGNGSATITATSGSASGNATVTVENPDRAALVALYNATDGPNWVNSENWLSDAPLRDWYGVDTDASGRVVALNLAGSTEDWPDIAPHGLKGPIPPAIGSLGNLGHLDLGHNDLTGPIPAELGSLPSLTWLGLGGNQLTGPIPSELGNLASLMSLYLWGNDLTGPIPTELGSLGNLANLDLAHNDLTGPIPAELGNLASLTWLGLGGNQLTGAIPSALGNLASLTSLYLFGNDLTGAIPPALGSLGNLGHLDLSWNDLTGPIPVELGNLGSLERLFFQKEPMAVRPPAPLPDRTHGSRGLQCRGDRAVRTTRRGLSSVAGRDHRGFGDKLRGGAESRAAGHGMAVAGRDHSRRPVELRQRVVCGTGQKAHGGTDG